MSLQVLLDGLRRLARAVRATVVLLFQRYGQELIYPLLMLVWAAIRATAALVESGHRGLLFSFGRARRELEPGLRLLIPFLQVVRIVPTRSRTLDLAAQRVTTLDGLVYRVDSSLVYRIVELRKALIEIDDLQRGMLQTLGLAVQEVLCGLQRDQLKVTPALNDRLAALMTSRLAAWGVTVERVGMTSITPSPETLRLTQLGQRTAQRRAALALLEQAGVPAVLGLPLLGAARLPRRRVVRAILLEQRGRRRRRLARIGRWLARLHGVADRREVQGLIDRALQPVRQTGYSKRGRSISNTRPSSA